MSAPGGRCARSPHDLQDKLRIIYIDIDAAQTGEQQPSVGRFWLHVRQSLRRLSMLPFLRIRRLRVFADAYDSISVFDCALAKDAHFLASDGLQIGWLSFESGRVSRRQDLSTALGRRCRVWGGGRASLHCAPSSSTRTSLARVDIQESMSDMRYRTKSLLPW
jgi:hypothetical protein